MKQLQLGMVSDEVFDRFNRLVLALSNKKGNRMSKREVFEMMLKEAENEIEAK